MNASFEHLKSILQSPAGATQAQQAFDRQRMATVEKAARARPHFLPIQHTLPAAAQNSPIAQSTDPLKHDVIIFGAVTDGEDRNIRFYRDVDAYPIVRYGSEQGLKLSLDAIAGHSVASAGFPGVFRYPEPFLIRRDKLLTVEMYQEASPGTPEIVSTVFCGEREYSVAAAEAILSADEQNLVRQHIARRPAPEPRYGVFPVAFDADGFATAQTAKANEPLLILGFRSTFTDALVNFGFDSGLSFSKAKFPIWALCNEQNNGRGLFQMLKSPLYIPANQQLLFSFTNTIDGVTFATDGNVEILMRTP